MTINKRRTERRGRAEVVRGGTEHTATDKTQNRNRRNRNEMYVVSRGLTSPMQGSGGHPRTLVYHDLRYV